jgi:Tfp pilus assembly ATPase PilU
MNPTPTRGPEVEKLLHYMVRCGATDLAVEPNRPLVLQVQGAAQEAEIHPLDAVDVTGLVAPLLEGGRAKTLRESGEVTFAHTLAGSGERFLVRISNHRGQPALAVHRLGPTDPRPLVAAGT